MKLTIDREPLLAALAAAHSATEKRNTIPVLANVLIQAIASDLPGAPAELLITGTNMELAIEVTATAQIEAPGRTTLPAAVLSDIVRKLKPGASISLTQRSGESTVALRSGRYSTVLNAIDPDDFPSIEPKVLPPAFTLPGAELVKLIDTVKFAISKEETRYYLNGIYFHRVGDKLRGVSTDGHRLAICDIAAPEGAAVQGMPGVIVPRGSIDALRKLADGGDVQLRVSKSQMQAQAGTVRLITKLIDGTFPEYDRVVPRDNANCVTLDKREFGSMIGRVAAIGGERSRPVKLTLSKDRLQLEGQNSEVGTSVEEMEDGSVKYDGPHVQVGFQARYLNDVLDVVGGDVEFAFGGDSNAPALLRDTKNADARFVLMPMRV